MPKAIQFELLLFFQCPHYLFKFRKVPTESEYTQKKTLWTLVYLYIFTYLCNVNWDTYFVSWCRIRLKNYRIIFDYCLGIFWKILWGYYKGSSLDSLYQDLYSKEAFLTVLNFLLKLRCTEYIGKHLCMHTSPSI